MIRTRVTTQHESQEHNYNQEEAKNPTFLSVSFTDKRKSETDRTENYEFLC